MAKDVKKIILISAIIITLPLTIFALSSVVKIIQNLGILFGTYLNQIYSLTIL